MAVGAMSSAERVEVKKSIRHLFVSKVSSGDTSALAKIGIFGKSIDELNMDQFSDKVLVLLNQELKKTSDQPNHYLRAELLKTRFAKTISKSIDAPPQQQRPNGRRNWEETKKELKRIEIEREDGRRNLEEEKKELKKIEIQRENMRRERDRQRDVDIDKQRAEARKAIENVQKVDDQQDDKRAAARKAIKEMKKIDGLSWPEDNFKVMRDFELLINGGRYHPYR